MADFTFIHAADLHLGSPFLGLGGNDPDLATRFAAASRQAFVKLIDQAIERRVALLLIAGDIYDRDWKDTRIGLFFSAQVARATRAGIRVFTIRGNHDAASQVRRAVPLPDGVHEFDHRKPGTVVLDDLGTAIHGRSFPDRVVEENFALGYPPPVAGLLNIGLLHTSLSGSPLHDTYAPCTEADLARAGYDYWALGHIHAFAIVARDPWIVFPGNLQGRSVRECGPKGAVLVTVADGRIRTAPERLILDEARFADIAVSLDGVEDEKDLAAAIRAAAAPHVAEAEGRLLAARLTLTGTTGLHGALAADPRRAREDALFALQHLSADIVIEKLKLATRPPEDTVWHGGTLDLDAQLEAVTADAEFDALLAQDLALAREKMPAELRATFEVDQSVLVAEALDLLRGRLAAGRR